MNRKLSTAEKVRRMIEQGYTNKDIIERLSVKPQAVYNARYQINKARGLGALTPTPRTKRKYTRRVKALSTGITPPPPEIKPYTPYPVKPGNYAELPVIMIEPDPKPTLWQRVKGWFRGANA